MTQPKYSYRIVRTRQDLEGALALVFKEYKRRGYIPKGYKSNLRISLHNALPQTTTFIATQADKVVAGVTLIPDTPIGLPMDKLYKKELDSLREKGCQIAEVSQLSIDASLFTEGMFSMFNFDKLIFVFRLFKLILDYSQHTGVLTDACFVVNPRHQYLYKFLSAEKIGQLRYYGSVNRAPALPFRIDLTSAEEKVKPRQGLYKIFFGEKTDPQVFADKLRMTAADLEYFFVKKSDTFIKAEKHHLDYIRSCYPEGELDKILPRV